MTTRPGDAALALFTTQRQKRIANLVAVKRTDGVWMYWADHDRPIVFEGKTYQPAHFVGMSNERREVGLRTADQEMHGILSSSGDAMSVPDLLGHKYRGAEVWAVETDWRYPRRAIARTYKRVRGIRFDGLKWVAALESIASVLERNSGGRFNGVQTFECGYIYGGPYCRKDYSADVRKGAKVATVTDARLTFTIGAASFPGAFADDWFRDGEIEWLWATAVDSGNATATATSLTDGSKSWTVDEHVGRYLLVLDGVDGQWKDYALITANTATVLTYETLPGTPPYAAHDYEICPRSANHGKISPIIRHVNATREIELTLPTGADIAVGDRGDLRPGCNGLFTSCQARGNSDNFGGNHLQPQPGDVLEIVP